MGCLNHCPLKAELLRSCCTHVGRRNKRKGPYRNLSAWLPEAKVSLPSAQECSEHTPTSESRTQRHEARRGGGFSLQLVQGPPLPHSLFPASAQLTAEVHFLQRSTGIAHPQRPQPQQTTHVLTAHVKSEHPEMSIGPPMSRAHPVPSHLWPSDEAKPSLALCLAPQFL